MPSEIDEIDLVSTFLIIEGIVNLKKKFLEEMPWNLHIVYLIKIWRRVKRTDIYLGIWLGKQRSTAVSAGEKYKKYITTDTRIDYHIQNLYKQSNIITPLLYHILLGVKNNRCLYFCLSV